MKKAFRLSLGLLISFTCLFYVLKDFQFSELKTSISNGIWIWMIPTTIIYVGNYLSRTVRWKIILKPVSQVRFSPAFFILTLGFFVNNILPFRAGEIARAMAGAHETKKPFTSILGTIAFERLTDLFGLFFILLCASRVLGEENLPFRQLIPILSVGVLGVLGLIWFSRKIESTPLGANESWTTKLKILFKKFTSGFHSFKSPKDLFFIGILAMGIWATEAVAAMILSRFFGLDFNFWQAAALIVGTSLGVMVPAAPGYIGTFEFFAHQTLVLLGFPEGPALSFVLVWHFMQFVIVAIIGLPYIIRAGGLPDGIFKKSEVRKT